MRLDRLDIDRLPGLTDRFDLEFGAGINLVLGPNASGKSSVARAVRGLLWPERAGQEGNLLTARFVDDGGRLEASRDGAVAVTWRRDGNPAAPPVVPEGHLAECYRLGVTDLLEMRTDGLTDRLAAEIRKAMSGGIDLDGLVRDMPKVNKGSATTKGRAWQQATREVARIGLEQTALEDRRRGLDELCEKLRQAETAGTRYRALVLLRDLRRVRRARAAVEQTLAEFPSGMAAITADDGANHETLAHTISRKSALAAHLAEQCARLDEQIAALALPDGDTPSLDLPACGALAATCRAAAARADIGRAELAAADTAWLAARAAVADDSLPTEALPDAAAMEALADLHRAVGGGEATVASLEALRRELVDSKRVPAWRGWLFLAMGFLLTAMGYSPFGLPAMYAAAGLVFGAALIVLGAVDLTGGVRGRLIRETAARLERQQLDAKQELARLVRQRQGLADEWTLGRRLDGTDWLRDLENLREATRRRHDLDAATAAVRELDLQVARALAAFNTAAVALGAEPAATADQVDAVVAGLQARIENRHHLRERRELVTAERVTALNDLENARRSLQMLLKRVDLPADADEAGTAAGIQLRVKRLADWTAADEKVRQHARDAARLERELASPDVAPPPGIDDLEDVALETRIATEQRLAEDLSSLSRQVAELEQEVRAVTAGNARGQAIAEETRRRDDLLAWRQAAREQALEAALLDELRHEHDALISPPQQETAKQLFQQFTNSAYSLSVATGDDGPVFQARDRTTGRRLDLSQLSDGTRCQLLLAVRLAFLQHAETAGPLPLFLDESLTTTDASRLTAIAESLGALARDTGRQIFYLTSNAADVAAWRSSQATADLPEPTVVDLAVARTRDRTADEAEMAPTPARTWPPVADHDPASYGRLLGVTRFDPQRAWQEADTFHLAAPDLETVRTLRSLSQTSAGSLDAFLDRTESEVLLDADVRETLVTAIAVLKVFVESWRLGRPRPVEIADIERSDAVTATWRSRILKLLAEVDHNGDRLLEELRDGAVSRFQTKATEGLATELAEIGCLDERTPLSDDALHAEVQLRTAHRQKESRTSVTDVREIVHRLLQAIPLEIVQDPSSRPPSGSDPTD